MEPPVQCTITHDTIVSSSRSKKRCKRTSSLAKKRRKRDRHGEYASSDDDSSDQDGSENEDDGNFVSKAKGADVYGTHTRGSSRPTRSAAAKANKNLATRKQGTDYHQHPELLYEQQVYRY